MITRQKLGLALVAGSLISTFILQTVFSCLYSPEAIHDINIIPAPADLTPILFILATNWAVVFPLFGLFVCGLLCVLVPPRQPQDEPQLIKIHYVH